jgi:hypothetical protein
VPALRRIVLLLLACLCLIRTGAAQAAHTQDFGEVVVPISSVKVGHSLKLSISGGLVPHLDLNAGFGTGFCLDEACSFVVTNYHVAITTSPRAIQGDKIVQHYFATGPKDEGATPNMVGNDVLAYATKRDLAVFELNHSLPRHHGLSFDLGELEPGHEVDIYAYPNGLVNPLHKLKRFPAVFKGPTTSDLLAFKYESPHNTFRMGGSSGGIVVDRGTEKIVGILSGATETTAMAVSVQTLVDFVSKVQPFLAQRIFPSSKQVSPTSADLYPKFIQPRSDRLEQRLEESHEVIMLRQKSQALADSIRNFIAVQSYAWGSGDKAPDVQAAYEVRVIDGVQRFRSYPDGRKESDDIPSPPRSAWVLPANEWSKLPKMIGTELRLKVHQAPDTVASERRIKVFQYYASVEDDVCSFESTGFFTSKKIVVSCYGEVWTDDSLNILRISERLDFSDKLKARVGWRNVGVVVTYSSLKQPGESPRLVPWTIFTEASDKNHVYWCRGNFTDYREFRVGARLITEEARSPE